MCNYFHGNGYECFGDGHLWDADSDGVQPDVHRMPCPACNTKAFLLDRQEEAECTSEGHIGRVCFTGETLWLDAVRIALSCNKEAAEIALREIRIVQPLVPHPTDSTESVAKTYLF